MKKILIIIFVLLSSLLSAETGKASWYGIKCNGGTHTASGIKLKDYAMTAAHKSLKMGTRIKVTNLDNNKSVVVTITDRGPYIKGRVVDLTKGAFQKICCLNKGVCRVRIEKLSS